jgi:hypothetical protein
MEGAQRLQGRWLQAEDVAWLRNWIGSHPEWSRKRIARELCEAWGWRDGRGRAKDFAARSLLLKLAGQGHLRLPALRWPRKASWCERPRNEPVQWQEPAVLASSLERLRPLRIEVVAAGTASHRRWSFYLARYHYLGLRLVGENLRYLVRDRAGREVGCLLFGAAAWRCAPRDRFLGWSGAERAAGLSQIANNTRFLILPWVQVPLAASHILGAVARRIDGDWRHKYGHGLRWLETFVDRSRFAGTCYRAANWRCLGQTQGRSRQDRAHRTQVTVKDIYLYRLGGKRR